MGLGLTEPKESPDLKHEHSNMKTSQKRLDRKFKQYDATESILKVNASVVEGHTHNKNTKTCMKTNMSHRIEVVGGLGVGMSLGGLQWNFNCSKHF